MSKVVKDQLIMIKSTRTPGVTRKLSTDYLNLQKIFMQDFPERLVEEMPFKNYRIYQ